MNAKANVACTSALMEALARRGVTHFVVSSGARCAPLIAAVAGSNQARIWPVPDERSAAFRALGIAKATHVPAALICTSGTAAAQYWPAIVEAFYARVPLIVLTADRPPRLRNRGAPQTIDQINLYGTHTRYFCDLPVPAEIGDAARWAAEAERAFANATTTPQGPVHLNTPFDEPLIPSPDELEDARAAGRGTVGTWPADIHSHGPTSVRDDSEADGLAQQLQAARRPLIVCGPESVDPEDAAELVDLAQSAAAPILADVASQVRFASLQEGVCAHYHLYLRDRGIGDELAPDFVLRWGRLPTSKTLNLWLQGLANVPVVAVDRSGQPDDPYGYVTQSLMASAGDLSRTLRGRLQSGSAQDPSFRKSWIAADDAANCAIVETSDTSDCYEGDCVAAVFDAAGDEDVVFLSSSMPIRYAEMLAAARPSRVRVLCNRGANGIDGLISSASGAAYALGRPVTLLVGDIALGHDISGLGDLAERGVPLRVVVFNNHGGGIFSYLPLAEHVEFFEPLVAMPHRRSFAAAAQFYGVAYRSLRRTNEFIAALQQPAGTNKPEIIEIQTDRMQAHRWTQRLAETVTDAVRQALS